MKQPIDRELLVINGKTVELYRMDDYTYQVFVHQDYESDDEIIGVGENADRQKAIDIAVEDLHRQLYLN